MKASSKGAFLLFAALGVPIDLPAEQALTTVHSFTGGANGMRPLAQLILSSNTLYGTSDGLPPGYIVDSFRGAEGPYSNSTVFKVNMDGSGFTTLHTFTTTSGSWPFTNGDGAIRAPNGALLLSSNTLYGTAACGGLLGFGTVFRVNIDGSGFANLHNFLEPINSDGSIPSAGLVLSGETLYGTAAFYGSVGSIFKVNTDGSGFATLYRFHNGSDSAFPQSGLILSGNTLYGTAQGGEVNDFTTYGSVFKLNTNGSGFTVLHSFSASSSSFPYTNSDGDDPMGRLILSGNTLYGTTMEGGHSGFGTVFRVNTDGTGFTNLHSFAAPTTDLITNSEGFGSCAALVLVRNTLYGTALRGGHSGFGTVFQLNTDGSDFEVLHHFTGGGDGEFPGNGLVVVSNRLYGTAWAGGASSNGIVFSLSLPPPQLSTIHATTNVILSWSTNFDFALQSTTNLASAVWTTNLPSPVVINGRFTVTNAISRKRQFFRPAGSLSQ